MKKKYKKEKTMDGLASKHDASNYTDATHNSLANLITPLFFFLFF
jgi:hypothetical protein